MTPERLEDLRDLLQNGSRDQKLDELAARPDVAMPATHRRFGLRDMVRDCVKKLERSGVTR